MKQAQKQLYQFIKTSVNKFDSRPFKVPNDIVMMVIDANSGKKVKFNTRNTIIENYKKKDLVDNIVRNSNNIIEKNDILKFY